MDMDLVREIERECKRLVLAATQYGDHREFESAVALFADDGTRFRYGKAFTGHPAILETYTSISPTRVVRHINGGTVIDVIDQNTARGVTYYLVIRYEPEVEQPAFPLPFEAPFLMGEWHDRFVRTAQGWRFSSRTSKWLFQRQD